MPLILLRSEGGHTHGAREEAILLTLVVLKYDAHGVRIFLVFVDQHQRPFSIGANQRIRSDQNMAGGVADVARTGENAVHTSSRLDPFQIDHLAGKELRVGLLHIVVRIHREHSKRSGRGSVASKRLAERDVVKVVDGVATSLKKRSDIISPPKCDEYVHERVLIAGCDVR